LFYEHNVIIAPIAVIKFTIIDAGVSIEDSIIDTLSNVPFEESRSECESQARDFRAFGYDNESMTCMVHTARARSISRYFNSCSGVMTILTFSTFHIFSR